MDLYVRRAVNPDHTQGYIRHLQQSVHGVLGNGRKFHNRKQPAATLLNPPVILRAMESPRFVQHDPAEVRHLLLDGLPASRLDTIDVEPTEIKSLENGRTPVLAVMIASAGLEEERGHLLEALGSLSGLDFDKYYNDLHITIGRFIGPVEHATLGAAEQNLPKMLKLQPVEPLT